MMAGAVRIAVVTLLSAVLLVGCFSKAKQQHKSLDDNYVLIEGRVEWEPPVEGPVVISISTASSPASAWIAKIVIHTL